LAGIELGLELKFSDVGLQLLPEIYKIEDVDVLRAVHNGIRAVSTLDALRRIYQQNGDNDDGSQDPTDSHEPSIRAESASTGR